MLSKEEALGRFDALLHNPAASDESIEEVFLQLMAEELLVAGYKHAQRRGRGVMLYDLRGAFGWRSGQMPTLYYLTFHDMLTAGIDPAEGTEAEIKAYDPNREVLVIFLYGKHHSSGRVISQSYLSS
ncbi:MAG: hypothetical protein HC837_03950 [Chloroflexaceae bacterium]|nr:hypothetical protein [Chloroflexaceae bacterium]